MTTPPPLFDRPAQLRHRRRATDHGLFLHHSARDMIEDRLAVVNRTFTAPAIVTAFPQVWADFAPAPHILRDDDTLDLSPGSHDLILHAMSLHGANDPVGQLIQCRRALKPDGLFIAVLLGAPTLQELRTALQQAEAQLSGGLSARMAPMADIRDLGALLQRAGFALPVADSDEITAEYRDLPHLMHDLRAMAEVNALTDRPRQFTRRALFDRAAALYADQFALPNARLPATFNLITLTGWAPADSQPKPLRPGSATSRLADALGTDEVNLPD